MAACIIGANLYVHAYAESTWGTKPGSPVYVFIPVEEYGIAKVRNRRTSRPYFGNFGRKHGQTSSMMVQGAVRGALYGWFPGAPSITTSLAQYLINLAYADPNECELPSIGMEFAQGPDLANQRHQGLRMNQFTLSGSADSGRWDWSGDFMGKNEVTFTAQDVPDNLHKLTEFDFAGSVLLINDESIEFESLQLVRNNGLKPKYGANTSPHMMDRTVRETTLSFDLVKDSDVYHAAARALSDPEYVIKLILIGRHNGTSTNTFTRITFDIPRAQLVDPNDRYAIDDYVMSTIQLDCLKPDTSSQEIAVTYDTSDEAVDPTTTP